MTSTYDAIIVGARCAGSPTAMLLARQGYRILLVDRARFPSDTVSTLLIQPAGVAALARWGLLAGVAATGAPPIPTQSFDFGPLTIRGTPHPVDGNSTSYAPRRTLLDSLLVQAAADAGAEVRQGFIVDGLVSDGDRVVGIRGRDAGGRPVTEHARVVVGADGTHSRIARAVQPEVYLAKPPLQSAYYSYWSNLPVDGVEITIRPQRGWGAIPTNDDLTLLVLSWPMSEYAVNKSDVEGNYSRTLELSPAFAERVRVATRESRFAGTPVRNHFRRPYGSGWALVGDAGYVRDPITAQGISDAFLDAELLVQALSAALDGGQPYETALAGYQAARDARVLPMYEFTTDLATLEPPPPEMQQLLGRVAGNQAAMDAFVSVAVGTLSPSTFFDPAYLGGVLQQAPLAGTS